jgi:TatD DNase family protein
MSSHYVDLHCHLDLYPDFVTAVQDAERACVYTLAVTTTPKAWPRNREVTQGTRYVRAALGLHPQLVHERGDEISLWDKYLAETRYIGEVGIDASPRYYHSLGKQKEVFEHVLRMSAQHGNKVLSVHSVRSARIVLDLVESHLPSSKGAVVLHWFSGSLSEARRAAELGCYFSINSQMLSNERGRRLVASLSVDRILTETDGPFTQIKERVACPSDVGQTVQAIAELQKFPAQEIKDLIAKNFKSILAAEPE